MFACINIGCFKVLVMFRFLLFLLSLLFANFIFIYLFGFWIVFSSSVLLLLLLHSSYNYWCINRMHTHIRPDRVCTVNLISTKQSIYGYLIFAVVSTNSLDMFFRSSWIAISVYRKLFSSCVVYFCCFVIETINCMPTFAWAKCAAIITKKRHK